MSDDLVNNKAEGHGSTTDYASEVFEESSVCGVSTILSTEKKSRKIFRSVVFLLFTVAFLYQGIAFLCYALKYPTIVDEEIFRPERFMQPAYTFCNFNPVRRSKFCEKFPDNCTKPDKEFCEDNPRFCGTPDTHIVKNDIYDLDNLEELYDMNHDGEGMAGVYPDEEDNHLSGPFPRSKPGEMGVAACFSYFERVGNSLDPVEKRRTQLATGYRETYLLDPEENELLYPETQSGILFEVHSPFEAVNPFISGVFMRPGYHYRIAVKMTQEELLPYDCLNYTEVWLKNNKTGYRSQAACRQKCVGDMTIKCYSCIDPQVLYPYPNGSICVDNIHSQKPSEDCKDPEGVIANCINGCKDECTKMKFSYDVKENFLNRYAMGFEKNESRIIRVMIDFPDVDIHKVVHKPQFQVLEVFSLIGGLLAFWIGLSMVQVIEAFDCIFQIVKHLLKNISKGSENPSA